MNPIEWWKDKIEAQIWDPGRTPGTEKRHDSKQGREEVSIGDWIGHREGGDESKTGIAEDL